ncbi:uncharacterized protein [Clytia hemisphaerica]|uniref:uncharacterized protein n=1 Tax=Clytia hemisphaerica TaxID=252671 RepID=UPI0034D3FF4E
MSTYCRLCRGTYKVSKKGKVTDSPIRIFAKREDGQASERLRSLGILVKECNEKASTICRKCQRAIKAFEDGEKVKMKWRENVLKDPPNENKENFPNKRKTNDTVTDVGAKKPRVEEEEQVDDRSWLFSLLKDECQKEMLEMLRQSKISNVSNEALIAFDPEAMCSELDRICPIISTVMKAALGPADSKRTSRVGHRIMCYGILYKGRFGFSRPSVIAHRNNQLSVAAGVKKRAFQWFNKLGVTNSYTTALDKHKSLGIDFDKEFMRWKKE